MYVTIYIVILTKSSLNNKNYENTKTNVEDLYIETDFPPAQ